MNSTSNSTADDEHAALKKVMESTGILKRYEKFRDAQITVDIIWKLDDSILNDELKLSGIEKLKYSTAKEKHQSEK